jgi:hypothetical protein
MVISCSDKKQESKKESVIKDSAVSSDVSPKDYTAKAPFDQVRKLAREWQPDAVLTRIYTVINADEDGTASVFGWAYEFYSPNKEAWHKVAAHPDTGAKGMRLPSGKRSSIEDNFIDSSDAIKEARKNGFTAQTDINMELRVIGTESQLKPGAYWCVGTTENVTMTGLKGYCIDAATGKFAARIGR